MIACRALIGFGIPRIQDTRTAHGGKLTTEDTDAAREALGWPHPPFVVPKDILSAWRAAGARGAEARRAWEARLAVLPNDDRAEFERRMAGALPEAWRRRATGRAP
ncbi:hypothetical protein [uncultured Rhodospira sp.]|uniref:hypothetical protein n=1 Tax=uncultured Rhodospira sp. TaxID=1936189 RepID=UPI00262CAB80|nr:hypothetical protein [uncultured Rhodospira sp.]